MRRTTTQDDVLPLTKPIVSTSGRVYTELPIPKETTVTVAMSGYNLCAFVFDPLSRALIRVFFCGRNQDVWGPDAYEFRPERWFEMGEKAESPVGVHANL